MIRAEDIVFEYIRRDEKDEVVGVQTALDHLSFRVNKGEFVAILGHNGSGKSTLARHINALLTPEEGTVYVDRMDTSDGEMVWEIRQRAGMVFQNPDNQIVYNVVEDDVGFGPENLGVPTEEIWQRVESSLEKTGLLPFRKSSPNNLSGGQKQRLAIAGILAMRPSCIVLDEATAMLDPKGRREVLQTVQELNRKENMTVLWITHRMEEVIDADRVLVLDHGKIVLTGTPREVFAQVDVLRACRLDVPQAALMAHELQKRGLQLPEGILTAEELVDALAYNLGR